jgi:hypothetical protein
VKKWIILALAALGALLLFRLLTRPKADPRLLTPEQKNAANNATLSAYEQVMPPIAMLSRLPWANTNLRSVDPVVMPPLYPPAIYQN